MSNQPSTLDNVRSAAANATHVVAASLDPADETNLAQKSKNGTTIDGQGQPTTKGSYKDQLNDAANGNLVTEKAPETIVEKVAAYVPGLSSVLGTNAKPADTATGAINDGAPPQRPEHDVQVEEFIKEQYKSKSGQNMPDVGDKN